MAGTWSGPSFGPLSALGAVTSGLGELGRDLVGTWSGPSFGPLSVFVILPICCLGRQLKPMFIFCCMLWKVYRLVATPKTQRFSKFACLVLPGGSFDLRYIGSQRLLQSSGINFFRMSCSLLSTSILQISLGALNSGSARGCKRDAGLRASSRKASAAHAVAAETRGPPILPERCGSSRGCIQPRGSTHLVRELQQFTGLPQKRGSSPVVPGSRGSSLGYG